MNLWSHSISSLKSKFLEVATCRKIYIEQVRHSRRANLRKPRKHHRREVVNILTIPTYKKWYDGLSPYESCSKAVLSRLKQSEGNKYHPLDQLVAEEVREKFHESKFIVIFHTHPRTNDQFYDLRVALNKLELAYLRHYNTIINLALQGTKFEPLLKIYEGPSVTFIGAKAEFSKLLRVEKRFSFVSLLCAVYEGRIMSISDLTKFAAYSNIEYFHSQLCGTLISHCRQLTSNISNHQQQLTSSLTRYIEDQKSK